MSQARSQHVSGNSNTNCCNISNSYNTVVNESDEKLRILAWLSPLESQRRHQDIRAERLEGVGNWVLRTNEFQDWRDAEDGSTGQTLFCSGAPGVGKTYIASLVIDTLCAEIGGQNAAVFALYCDFLAQQEQTTVAMIGSLLKQVIARLPVIPREVQEAFEKSGNNIGGQGLQLSDILELLKTCFALVGKVFICIDALDEILPKRRPELLRSLQSITQGSPGARLFITGRPHIQAELDRYLTQNKRIIISPSMEDILKYLEKKLDEDTEPDAMSDSLKEEIMMRIPEAISEIFLLVSLVIDSILGEKTVHRRRERLRNMTNGLGLGDAYGATLDRIKKQSGSGPELGMAVLMWISHSKRPLQVSELCHALAVEVGTLNLIPDNVPSIRTLLACCLGLVTVDASSSTVRLVHFTFQEYLLANPAMFGKTHSAVAEVCLTYLNFKCVEDLPPTPAKPPLETPFLTYASCYWGDHARGEVTADIRSLALKLLARCESHISVRLHIRKTYLGLPWWHPKKDGDWDVIPALHYIAYLGIPEIARDLMDTNSWDVNRVDVTGSTPLLWAVRSGAVEIVKLLLEQSSIAADIQDTYYGRTPLSKAAENGNEAIVRMLLDREDINADLVDLAGRTPLSRAAGGGSEAVVKLLLDQKDVDPDSADNDGRTPLSWAAEDGSEAVVKLLLDQKDVNPDSADNYGGAPLSWAAEDGSEAVVKLLLDQKGVNPNSADNGGRTPLSWAAGGGSEAVVKLLLDQKDVDPDSVDNYGRTPRFWAAADQHQKVVQLLQDHQQDANSSSMENCG